MLGLLVPMIRWLVKQVQSMSLQQHLKSLDFFGYQSKKPGLEQMELMLHMCSVILQLVRLVLSKNYQQS